MWALAVGPSRTWVLQTMRGVTTVCAGTAVQHHLTEDTGALLPGQQQMRRTAFSQVRSAVSLVCIPLGLSTTVRQTLLFLFTHSCRCA